MHHEDALLSWAIQNNDLSALIRQGIRPAYFYKRAQEASAFFSYYHDNRQLPSPTIAQEIAPRVSWGDVDERDVPEYIQRCREYHLQNELAGTTNEMLSAGDKKDWETFFAKSHEIRKLQRILKPPVIYDYDEPEERFNLVNEKSQQLADGINRFPFFHQQLNDYMGDYVPGRLYLPMGRPKKGKSHFLYLQGHKFRQAGLDGIFFSYEMHPYDIQYAMDSIEFKYSITGLQSGIATKMDRDGNVISSDLDTYRRDLMSADAEYGKFYTVGRQGTGDVTIDVIRSYVEDLQPHYILVDYIRIVDVDRAELQDATTRSAYVAHELKKIAQDFQIVVIAPHQLNRAAETSGQVGLVHAADSDKVIQEADAAFHVDSEPVNGLNPDAPLERSGEMWYHVQVIGNRFGPAGGKFSLEWNFDTGHVREVNLGLNARDPQPVTDTGAEPGGFVL